MNFDRWYKCVVLALQVIILSMGVLVIGLLGA
jgi:hypothetical protein